MDSQAVVDIIADLPDSFKRPGNLYTAIQIALALPLAYYSTSSDSMASSLLLSSARWRMLDLIGTIWGIYRLPNERDEDYRLRIQAVYSISAGTFDGIIAFLQKAFDLSATVSFYPLSSSGAGYNIVFTQPLAAGEENDISEELSG